MYTLIIVAIGKDFSPKCHPNQNKIIFSYIINKWNGQTWRNVGRRNTIPLGVGQEASRDFHHSRIEQKQIIEIPPKDDKDSNKSKLKAIDN